MCCLQLVGMLILLPFSKRTILNVGFLTEAPICLYITWNFLNGVVPYPLEMFEQCKFIIWCFSLMQEFQSVHFGLKLDCDLMNLCSLMWWSMGQACDKQFAKELVTPLIYLTLKFYHSVPKWMHWSPSVASVKLFTRIHLVVSDLSPFETSCYIWKSEFPLQTNRLQMPPIQWKPKNSSWLVGF